MFAFVCALCENYWETCTKALSHPHSWLSTCFHDLDFAHFVERKIGMIGPKIVSENPVFFGSNVFRADNTRKWFRLIQAEVHCLSKLLTWNINIQKRAELFSCQKNWTFQIYSKSSTEAWARLNHFIEVNASQTKQTLILNNFYSREKLTVLVWLYPTTL